MVKEQWIKDKYVARLFLNNSAVVDYSKPELDEVNIQMRLNYRTNPISETIRADFTEQIRDCPEISSSRRMYD